MKKLITIDTVTYDLYIKTFGLEANARLVEHLGAQDFENYVVSRRLGGKPIELVSITKDKLEDFIETNKRGIVFKFDTYIGKRGERDVFPVVVSVLNNDTTFKSAFQQAIDVRLVAFKLASKPPSRVKMVHKRKLAYTGSTP
ncbi:MAG: hypothetical protein V4524_02790 [Patescibacteria group bacterium]